MTFRGRSLQESASRASDGRPDGTTDERARSVARNARSYVEGLDGRF
jgi:hypothetical protein